MFFKQPTNLTIGNFVTGATVTNTIGTDELEVLRDVCKEKSPKSPTFWQKFWHVLKYCKMWLFGGAVAFIPIVLVPIFDLIQGSVKKMFGVFNEVEFVYIIVTMAVIPLCDKPKKIEKSQFHLLVILLVIAVYGGVKLNPNASYPYLYVFNIFFLLIVLIIGLCGYWETCSKERRWTK